MTVFLRFPYQTKTKLVIALRLLWSWKLWGNTQILSLLTKTRAKSSSLLSMLVSHKIVTVLFCLGLPISLHLRQTPRIHLTLQTKSSLRSYKPKICQLETFKNFSKVWGATRQMNYQLYLRLISSRISVPSSIVK